MPCVSLEASIGPHVPYHLRKKYLEGLWGVSTSAIACEIREPANVSTHFLGSLSMWESELLYQSHESEGDRDRRGTETSEIAWQGLADMSVMSILGIPVS